MCARKKCVLRRSDAPTRTIQGHQKSAARGLDLHCIARFALFRYASAKQSIQLRPFMAALGIHMETSVDFKSELFKPFLPEDSQVNPRVYGAELAYWLSRALAQKNIITTYPEYEDWGWYLEYFVDDNEYMLCFSNSDEEGKEWRCFLRPQAKSLFGRNKAPVEKATPLLNSLKELLEDTPEISDIKWSNEYDT